MRDALGGTVTLVIIVFFIVVALGYAAFNVNYTKAFRMKDKIITTYEDYLGVCDSQCAKIIEDYADDIGYQPIHGSLNCDNGWEELNGLYCQKKVTVNNSQAGKFIGEIKPEGSKSDIAQKYYYKIRTKINIQIPIISNIFDFSIFNISGDTAAFRE